MAKEFPAKIRIGAIDSITRTLDKIKNKFPELDRAVRRTNNAFKSFQAQTAGVRDSLKKTGEQFKDVGGTLTAGITLPVIAAGAFAVKTFADYETALLGVGKTTNIAGAELAAMGKKFQLISKTVPVSVEELLGLGQTAAQLGVKGSDNILKFSETLAKLARASNIVGEEGASDLARLITVTNSSIGDVDRFASAIVNLGNNSAATEAEILGFATRLGGATALFNVSATDTLGIATALRSVGIEAEAGSSSIQRAFGQINKSILKGGSSLKSLSMLTGIAAGELKQRFKTDSVGVLREFAAGLARVEAKGGDVSQALAKFGLTGVRDIQVVGALAKNVNLLDEKLKLSRDGFKENTALQNEFNSASKSLNNQFTLVLNNIKILATSIGERLKPAFIGFFDVVNKIVTFLAANPTFAVMIGVMAGLAAAVGPVLLAFGAFLTLLPSLISGWGALTAVMIGFKFVTWAALAPVLLILAKFILIGALIGGLIFLIYKFRSAIMDGLVIALDFVVSKVDMLIEKLGGASGVLRKFLGLGAGGVEVKAAVKSADVIPQGKSIGGLETTEKLNREFNTQTNNARVDINVRAPESTKIVSESKGGVLSINRGMAGAF